MKRIIIILLTAAQCVTAQIVFSPNAFNTKGQKEGQWTLFFDENWKRVEAPAQAAFFRIINYKDGRPAGTARDYYLSGVLQWEGLIIKEENDISHGHVVYYHPNGKKSHKGEKVYDVMEGEWKEWHPDGRLASMGNYSNGERNGQWAFYYKDNTFSLGSYLKDRLEGEWTFYKADSGIAEKGTYVNGMREGRWILRDKEDGWSEGEYVAGSMNGLWSLFHPSGIKAAQGLMLENKKHGRWTYWSEDDTRIAEETMMHGVLHGHARYWDEDGELTWEGEYRNGQRQSNSVAIPTGSKLGSLKRL